MALHSGVRRWCPSHPRSGLDYCRRRRRATPKQSPSAQRDARRGTFWHRWAHADSQWKLQSEGLEQDERRWVGNLGSEVSDTDRSRLSLARPEPDGATGDWWAAET